MSRAATQLSYIRRSFQTQIVTTEKNWTFEEGVKSWAGVPNYVVFVFFSKRIISSTTPKKDTFHRPTISNAQCILFSYKTTDAGITCQNALGKYSQACGGYFSCFLQSYKKTDSTLQHWITKKDFVSSVNYPKSSWL